MKQGKDFFKKITEVPEVDLEVLPGVPLIEIYDNRRVLIENHMGILNYSCREVQIRMRYGCICVCGEQLKLMKMSKHDLVITGCIGALSLRR